MGADGAFERRRMELAVIARAAEGVEPPEEALERLQLDARPDEPAAEMQQMQAEAAESITDEAVVRSFQQQVDPAADSDSAFHLEYLRLGQLAHVCGDVLFVHGGVTTVNMGWVPGRPERVADARVWVDELNAWAAAQLEDFCESHPSGSQLAPRAAEALMDYGLPGGNDGRTVVYRYVGSLRSMRHCAKRNTPGPTRDGSTAERDNSAAERDGGSGTQLVPGGRQRCTAACGVVRVSVRRRYQHGGLGPYAARRRAQPDGYHGASGRGAARGERGHQLQPLQPHERVGGGQPRGGGGGG